MNRARRLTALDASEAATTPTRSRYGLTALAVLQFIGWGTLFFTPIVIAPAVARATGWAFTEIMLALAGGTVLSAVAGIGVGRMVDRGNPRLVVSCCVAIGAVGLMIVSSAPSLGVFAIGALAMGIGQAGGLYQPAFAIIVKRYRDARRAPMTIVTLAGGLSSTAFAPLSVALVPIWGWRGVLASCAVLLAATIPMHLLTLERAWPLPSRPAHVRRGLPPAVRTRRFWMLVVASALLVCSVNTATLAIIPVLTQKGATYEFAALCFGLIGAAQVVGRLLLLRPPPARRPPWVPLAVVSVAGAAALTALALLPGPLWLLLIVAMSTGVLRGSQTLINASAVADRWGTRDYGTLNGMFIAPATIATAVAPALGPFLAEGLGSYASMVLTLAGALGVAAVLSRWS